MIVLERVALNPWDFTLYRADDGRHVIKVVFSEGQYKFDVERYFEIGGPVDTSYDLDDLKALATKIREEYPMSSLNELSKSELTIQKR